MKRVLVPVLLLLLAAPLAGASASAATGSAKNISQSFGSSASLQAGTIVSLQQGSSDRVEAATVKNASRVVGVVVNADNSLVAVDPDPARTQVATSGTVPVLVSTVNGAIKKGDRITPSPFSGIGMKSLDEGYLIGTATAGFDSGSSGAASRQVTDNDGKRQTISVGYLPINITPGFNADTGSQGANGLQRFVKSLTGHLVSMPRIIISLVIAVVTIVAVVVLVYAAIYGSIMSIGRNPLAQQPILRALGAALLMAFLAVGVAFVFVFLLLR